MKSLTRSAIVGFFSLTSIVGCGGGGGGGGASDTCSTLRIAGGDQCPTPPAAVVAVLTSGGYCSGTFVTKRHVLTAAHCVWEGSRGVRVESPYFRASATRTQVHPLFNPASDSDEHDLAVVTIGQDAPVTQVAINTSSLVQQGESVVTYGYGLDEKDQDAYDRISSGEAAVKATTLDVISVSDFAIESISDGSGDTCRGDSGGSLLRTGNNGQPGIVAIVRAGPYECLPEGGSSDNTNLQSSSNLNFLRGAAPGVRFN